jgi:hypothetical protein
VIGVDQISPRTQADAAVPPPLPIDDVRAADRRARKEGRS